MINDQISQDFVLKQVYTEGRLIVEFTFDDMMRIRSWHFAVRNHRELIPRSVLAMQEPGMVESLSKNITRQGLTNTTLNYLRVITYSIFSFFWEGERTKRIRRIVKQISKKTKSHDSC